MKIFLISRTWTSSGGATKMLCWVANQMAIKGHDVYAVSYFDEETPKNLSSDVKYHNLGLIQSKNRLERNTTQMISSVARINKYIKSQNPDLIVSFLDSVGYIYLLFNKLFGKHKIVVSERVDPFSYKGILSKVRFFLMSLADGIVFQTKGAQSFFNEKIRKKSTVIPNPVSIKREISENLSSFQVDYFQRDNRIVTAGRLSLKQKRQDILLDAFEIVHKTHPEMMLVIYGEGEDRYKIQEYIQEKDITGSVILAGRTNEIEREIYNARTFALTSDFEGIPNALIEAMVLGVPSVSTDCSPGGARLLIENGENGFLVPCGDSEALAGKIMLLIENADISNSFTKNSPLIAEEYSQEKISNLWEAYFKQISNKE